MTANSTCAVQMLLVALSLRMCCSRVCSDKPVGGRAVGVDRHSDQSARQLPRMLGVHCQVAGVRTTEPHWHAEALGAAERYVGVDLAGRGDQRQRQQVGTDRHQRAALVRLARPGRSSR